MDLRTIAAKIGKFFFGGKFCHHDWTEWDEGGDQATSSIYKHGLEVKASRRCRNCERIELRVEKAD